MLAEVISRKRNQLPEFASAATTDIIETESSNTHTCVNVNIGPHQLTNSSGKLSSASDKRLAREFRATGVPLHSNQGIEHQISVLIRAPLPESETFAARTQIAES